MRESIAESITSTVKDLNKSGLIDEITMKNIENLCLPEIQEYYPEKIINIRVTINPIINSNLRSLFMKTIKSS